MSRSSLSRRVIGLPPQSWGANRQPACSGTQRALSVIGPTVEACQVSGTTAVSIDDGDNNSILSVGDVFTFAFANCQDVVSETLNGTVTLAITAIGATTLPSFSARMTFTQLSDEATDRQHGMTLNGSASLDYAKLSSTSDRLKVTASESVVSEVHTHAFGNDTVTMLPGFVEESTYDSTVPAPAGAAGTMPGSTAMTLAGNLRSAAAGGVVTVSTPGAIIVSYNADAYPRSGSLKIEGNKGAIQLTALSADQVRIDLDDNDDGVIESTRTDTWDWLL